MDSGKKQSILGKRVHRDSVDERSPRKLFPFVNKEVSNSTVEKVFEFCVLLPNGTSVDLTIRGKSGEIHLQEFVNRVRQEYLSRIGTFAPEKQEKTIDWKSQSLHIVDAYEKKITMKLNLEDFKANRCHILRLKDGSDEVDIFENMWNLTPATELLRELPEEYTYETALADLIDNSLQAVWSNKPGDRRLISVKITGQKIEIFDTGPGMDGSHENSLVQW